MMDRHSARKKRFRKFIKEKFFLRFHMSLILIATFLIGVIVSKVLLVFHVDKMFTRYSIAVVLSYLAFLLFIKLWLLYISVTSSRKDTSGFEEIPVDILGNAADSVSDISVDEAPTPIKPGGGSFGGGGATGSFEDLSEETSAALCEEAVSSEALGLSGEAASGATEGVAGEAAGAVVEGGGPILIVLGLIIALVSGAGVYIIYEAPAILSEVALEFLLASSLIRGARKLDRPDWISGVFRTTWKPFCAVLVISMVVAVALQVKCPQATKLTEVVKLCIK